MKFAFKLFVFLVVCAIAFVANPAFAKVGGVKADDDSDCSDKDTEENLITGGVVHVWVNLSGRPESSCGSLLAQVYVCDSESFNKEDCVIQAIGGWAACGSGTKLEDYCFTNYGASSCDGPCRVVVVDGQGDDIVGSDSYRVD